MNVSIYALIDPVTIKIRYIGRTTQTLHKRLIGHISKSKLKKTHRDRWIQSLIKVNKKPIIKEITIVIGWENSHIKERLYISKALTFGYDLTNHDDKGEGAKHKIITLEQKVKISNTLKEKYKLNLIQVTNTTKISTFNLLGNFIKEYPSCSMCVKDIGIPQSSLEKILSKKS